jgi:hypothetical protein
MKCIEEDKSLLADVVEETENFRVVLARRFIDAGNAVNFDDLSSN